MVRGRAHSLPPTPTLLNLATQTNQSVSPTRTKITRNISLTRSSPHHDPAAPQPPPSNEQTKKPQIQKVTFTAFEPLTTPVSPQSTTTKRPRKALWKTFTRQAYLEITNADCEKAQPEKADRIQNFLTIPAHFEKFMGLGYLVCLDAFLHTITILPARVLVALVALVFKRSKIGQAHLLDLIRGVLVLSCCLALNHVDASQMYHEIRGQSMLKLYVIFNVLEIFDRLCCSFGIDVLDSVLSDFSSMKPIRMHPIFRCITAAIYLFVHSMVLFYQAITLNVATNAHNSALLSLLISNQFVEIKGSVFKKFEKENLFQMSCADIVERFQLSMYLLIILIRNVFELSGSSVVTMAPIWSMWGYSVSVPQLTMTSARMWRFIIEPGIMVLGGEVLVDWLKHAFITKFNDIRPEVYDRYFQVVCKQINGNEMVEETRTDQSPTVARKIGFAAFPLVCLVVRISFQTAKMMSLELSLSLGVIFALIYACLLCAKIAVGLLLLHIARKTQ